MNRAELVAALDAGKEVGFLCFWGHTPKTPTRVDASCLSQWFPRPFVALGVTYATAEHFMMAEKARLFGDADALRAILASTGPKEAKALGRTVRGYDDARWSATRTEAVVRGNLAKFSHHADLRDFLLGTGDAVLVEASPRDRIWGIGLGPSNPAAKDPRAWKGQNLLGFALMQVRAELVAAAKG